MKILALFLASSLTLCGMTSDPSLFQLGSSALAQSATSAEDQGTTLDNSTAAEDQGTTPDESTAAEEQGTVPEGSSSPTDNAVTNSSPPPQVQPLTREQRAVDAVDDPNLSYKQRQKAERKLLKHQKPLEEGIGGGASADCTTNCEEEESSTLRPTD